MELTRSGWEDGSEAFVERMQRKQRVRIFDSFVLEVKKSVSQVRISCMSSVVAFSSSVMWRKASG